MSNLDQVSDISDVDDDFLKDEYNELKNEISQQNKMSDDDKRMLLMSALDEGQMERFETYRSMRINKPGLKKFTSSVLGQNVPPHLSVILAGLSKLYLSEIISKAYQLQENEIKESFKNFNSYTLKKGALQPEHIRKARRLYKLENSSEFTSQWKTQGEGDGKMFR